MTARACCANPLSLQGTKASTQRDVCDVDTPGLVGLADLQPFQQARENVAFSPWLAGAWLRVYSLNAHLRNMAPYSLPSRFQPIFRLQGFRNAPGAGKWACCVDFVYIPAHKWAITWEPYWRIIEGRAAR